MKRNLYEIKKTLSKDILSIDRLFRGRFRLIGYYSFKINKCFECSIKVPRYIQKEIEGMK